MGDLKNIRLGACNVSFKGTDLGYTKGGVEVSIETSTQETKVDQFGETIVAERINGRTVTVSVPMVESDIEKLSKVMPASQIVYEEVKDDESDPSLVTGYKQKLLVKVGEGTSLLDDAHSGELILTPVGENTGDLQLKVFRASTKGSMDFAYKHDEERVFELEFMCYPMENTTSNTNLLGNLYEIVDLSKVATADLPNDAVKVDKDNKVITV